MLRPFNTTSLKTVRSTIALVAAITAFASESTAQPVPAMAEPVSYSQTRSSSFEYDDTTGLLVQETVEPNTPDLCVRSTYSYVEVDGKNYGNRTQTVTEGCAGASSTAAFAARSARSNHVNVSDQPAGFLVGSMPTRLTNALNHTETRQIDPRFGFVTVTQGPNGLVTRWELDEFGRKVKETRADGTSTRMWYCYVGSAIANKTSNTPGCPVEAGTPLIPAPVAGEQPTLAVSFLHSQSYGKNGAVSGPWSRVYQDTRGRAIRSVSQAFDGGDGATAGKLIVKDTHYNQNGATILVSQPYFLGTGNSTVDGARHGFTYTKHDVLGRPLNIYTAAGLQPKPGLIHVADMDAYTRRLLTINFPETADVYYSVTSYDYEGLKTVMTRLQSSSTGVRNLVDTVWRNPLGKVVLTQDPAGAQTAFVLDAGDNLVTTLDPLGNRIDVRYDLRGRKVAMQDPNKGYWTYGYNALGELTTQTSPNQRRVGALTRTTYDVLGRVQTRVNSEFTTTFRYDTVTGVAGAAPCLNAGSGQTADAGTSNATSTLGKLCGTSTSHGVTRATVYDAKLRPLTQTTTANPDGRYVQKVFTQSTAYDANFGRPDTQTYPTGVAVKVKYTALGMAEAMANASDPSYEFWRALRINAWGQVEDARMGHGVNQRTRYDTFTGTTLMAGAGAGADASDVSLNVYKHNYVWDSLNNLQGRVDVHGAGANSAVSETFSYDELNRLTAYTWGSPAFPAETKRVDLSYNAVGNILYKSDTGSYVYPASGQQLPHAVVSIRSRTGAPVYNADYEYDGQGNLVRGLGDARYRSIRYNSFNLPQGDGYTPGILGVASGNNVAPRYDWAYDEGERRLVEKRTTSRGVRTTWYLHPDGANGLSYEEETDETGATTYRHYVSAGGGAVAHITTAAAAPTVFAKLEYWHKDHLGSTAAVTVAGGSGLRSMVKVLRYAYDPWGKRRYPNGVPDAANTLVADYHDGSIDAANGTDRGFTGHEHLDDIGLVHMNARIYDPMIARFMQGDPVVSNPFDAQTYNAYSYVYNRPLNTVDPEGREGFAIVAMVVMAAYGMKEVGIISSQEFRAVAAIAVAWWLAPAGGAALGSSVSGVEAAFVAGFASGAIATGNLEGAVQGGLTSVMFYGIGQAADSAQVAEAAAAADEMNEVATPSLWSNSGIGRAALHAAGGCVTAVAGGGGCGRGALTAGVGKLISGNVNVGNAAGGLAFAAVVGGALDEMGGGKFANGARMGAFQYLFNQMMSGRGNGAPAGGKQPGWGYEYPDVDHPFAPTEEFKVRFFGSVEERQVWSRTQEIAAGTAEAREWMKFDDPKAQLPRGGGPLYQIFDLGLDKAGAVRIAYSPKFPNVFYVSLDHYSPTTAQPLRWTRFEAAPPEN